jgi:hypothetical protein
MLKVKKEKSVLSLMKQGKNKQVDKLFKDAEKGKIIQLW